MFVTELYCGILRQWWRTAGAFSSFYTVRFLLTADHLWSCMRCLTLVVFAFHCFYCFCFLFFLLLIDVGSLPQLEMERLRSGCFVLGGYSKLGMGGGWTPLFENLFLTSGELSFLTLFCNYRASNVSGCFCSTGLSKCLGPAVVTSSLLASSHTFSPCAGHTACAVMWWATLASWKRVISLSGRVLTALLDNCASSSLRARQKQELEGEVRGDAEL